MTPEEAWPSKKPTISHLHTLECIVYMHIPQQQRRKLDKKSIKCIFIGYSIGNKAYRVYDPIAKKMHI